MAALSNACIENDPTAFNGRAVSEYGPVVQIRVRIGGLAARMCHSWLLFLWVSLARSRRRFCSVRSESGGGDSLPRDLGEISGVRILPFPRTSSQFGSRNTEDKVGLRLRLRLRIPLRMRVSGCMRGVRAWQARCGCVCETLLELPRPFLALRLWYAGIAANCGHQCKCA
eukprot:724704-Pleurochrysis_carterae.AAC.1